MSKMTVRASHALDEPTAARIRRLAARWRVSQAEVIRRAVREAADSELPAPLAPAEVVARCRSGALPRAAEAARDGAADNTLIAACVIRAKAAFVTVDRSGFEPLVAHGLHLVAEWINTVRRARLKTLETA